MSAATFLQALGIKNVPRVAPEKAAKVTAESHINQSSYPCYPCYPEKPKMAEEKREPDTQEPCQRKQSANPDVLLLEIAQTLEATPARLRALLSADDIQDIAEGAISQAHLLAYFRLMRSDGKPLASDENHPSPAGRGSAERTQRHTTRQGTTALGCADHEHFIDHVMACPDCYAPLSRYCIKGKDLRRIYLEITSRPPNI